MSTKYPGEYISKTFTEYTIIVTTSSSNTIYQFNSSGSITF